MHNVLPYFIAEKLPDHDLEVQSGSPISPISSESESVGPCELESVCAQSETESSNYTTLPSEPTEPDISDINAFLGPDTQPSFDPKLTTYKLVGDNIDKNVKPREMRADNQTRSLHYFHTYGVRDRIDLSAFSSEIKVPDVSSIQLENFLPSSRDEKIMKKNFGVIIGRILVKFVPFFKKFGKGLERHIQHEYSEEMSRKSEVVSLS